PGMAKNVSKKTRRWLVVGLIGVALAVFVGFKVYKTHQAKLPEGIVAGNGRLEAKLVDIAAKEPLRVKEILVDEGDMVKPDQVLVRLDTSTLDSELVAANAGVAAAQERLAFANASIVKQKSEINLANIEVGRLEKMVQEGS